MQNRLDEYHDNNEVINFFFLSRGPILENNGMLLSIEKKSLFVKKVACHDFRE
jgi:hypothetical protein